MAPKRKRAEAEKEHSPVEDPLPSVDPYVTLSVPNDATVDQIKTAYRKAALKHHPDKAPPGAKDEAHQQFQQIALAYAVLSDPRRRQRYDATGNTSDALALGDDDDFNWIDFFREQFSSVVTADAIEIFASQYKASNEEREHVLRAYTTVKGRMEGLYAHVMLSDMLEDEDRFRTIIDKAIADNEVEDYRAYSGESEIKRRKRLERARKQKLRESRAADKAAADLGDAQNAGRGKQGVPNGGNSSSIDSLAAMIQQRQQDRAGAFFDVLEAKYGGSDGNGTKPGRRGVASDDEPPEEDFINNRKKMKTKESTVTKPKRARREV